jgi:hypothetical protein
MEDDLIIGEEEKNDTLEIIDNQLMVINSVLDVPLDVYDSFDEDRIKVISNAMKIINTIQRTLLKELK